MAFFVYMKHPTKPKGVRLSPTTHTGSFMAEPITAQNGQDNGVFRHAAVLYIGLGIRDSTASPPTEASR